MVPGQEEGPKIYPCASYSASQHPLGNPWPCCSAPGGRCPGPELHQPWCHSAALWVAGGWRVIIMAFLLELIQSIRSDTEENSPDCSQGEAVLWVQEGPHLLVPQSWNQSWCKSQPRDLDQSHGPALLLVELQPNVWPWFRTHPWAVVPRAVPAQHRMWLRSWHHTALPRCRT